MRNSLVFILLALTVFIGGCNLRPSNVFSRSKMIDVTTAVLLVDAYVQDKYLPDSAVRLLYESVFAEHNVTREDYDSSLVWYGMNTERFASVYEEIQRKLSEERDLLDTLYNDSVREVRIRYVEPEDLWGLTQHRILIPQHEHYFAYSRFFSTIDSISGKDTIKWSMRTLPLLYEGEGLILSMYIQEDGKKHLYYRGADTIRSAVTSHEALFVLPDSLPPAYKMNFRLSYFRADSTRRTLPLLLDRIRLYNHRYVTQVETPSDTVPTPSTDPLEVAPHIEEEIASSQEAADTIPIEKDSGGSLR